MAINCVVINNKVMQKHATLYKREQILFAK